MLQQQQYRDNGAIGALLDEYERAVNELIQSLEPLNEFQFKTIVDSVTTDEDCRSIQTILTHVIRAGYNYVVAIRRHLGEQQDFRKDLKFNSISECQTALKDMFQFNVQFFEDHPNVKLEEYEEANKILCSWGQRFDVEQLFEHAIVHILRHRRQIERFLLKMNEA